MLKKQNLGWVLIIILSLSPILPWIFLQPLADRVATTYTIFRTIGEILGLVGITMFSLSMILSLRLTIFEDFFGGMNRVYGAHHLFGGISFILLLFHPLALAASYLPYSVASSALYVLPGNDWSINFGISALLLMMSLLILTFFVSLPYEIWRFTHKFLGAAFFMAAIHGFFVSSDISNSLVMKIYILTFLIPGFSAFIYKTILGRFLIKKYDYTVSRIKPLQNNIVEITLLPVNKKMKYKPGQFVFLNFKGEGVSNETHPFSISSMNPDNTVTFAIKEEGDYTTTLKNLTPGNQASIEGSFGRFLYDTVKNKQQIWVAGGIGITPFVSMAKSLPTEYTVDLYYSMRTEDEAVYLTDLINIATVNHNFRIFALYTKTQGRLTGDSIAQTSGDIIKKDIFVCGPPPMMNSLRKQLIALHVPAHHIHTEEFGLL